MYGAAVSLGEGVVVEHVGFVFGMMKFMMFMLNIVQDGALDQWPMAIRMATTKPPTAAAR